MNALHYNRIVFLKSSSKLTNLPPDVGQEVAFVGRSNSGKSSAINAITGVAKLARTSKTPGRTQLINFFELDNGHRLVDLPGYGYAKVPNEVKFQWEKLLDGYLSTRESLKGLILLMDIRHPLKPFDWQMIKWTLSQELPIHILLTKTDKLKRGAANQAFMNVKKELQGYESFITVQLFSAFTLLGVDLARQQLDAWLK